MTVGGRSWADHAVVYQVYVRSFADSDGDGVGDLRGIRDRLDYLVRLGVDALWLTPFYRSPMVDGGYDIADYRDVDPRLGCLADIDALLVATHRRGLKVLIDVVPNHTSDRHRWFVAALADGPGSSARERYIFRPGCGPGGGEPPNNWQSVFGGPAWSRVPDGDWYLHLFAPQQPDLNWDSPDVRAEFSRILRFWLDRGVDGLRVDVAHGLVKPAGLPDAEQPVEPGRRPYFDQDGVHEIYRGWRQTLDEYTPQRVMVAEARLRDPERVARYVRPGELDQAFNFEFLWAPWSADRLRTAATRSLAAMSAVRSVPSWVIGNHDEVRVATRLAGGVPGGGMADRPDTEPLAQPVAGAEVGLRRARAAALLSLALPGSAYIYQGDELGLPEVLDLPAEAREDPMWFRSGGTKVGRDGCRVPLPWSGEKPPFGFGPPDSARSWLPQPADWRDLSLEAQQSNPDSTWSMYAAALRLRTRHLRGPELAWLPAPADVIAFRRGDTFVCLTNVSGAPLALDQFDLPGPPLLTSAPLDRPGKLPADTTGWFGPSLS
jgi:alpha-glucosidase